jgi:hypothetical protein
MADIQWGANYGLGSVFGHEAEATALWWEFPHERTETASSSIASRSGRAHATQPRRQHNSERPASVSGSASKKCDPKPFHTMVAHSMKLNVEYPHIHVACGCCATHTKTCAHILKIPLFTHKPNKTANSSLFASEPRCVIAEHCSLGRVYPRQGAQFLADWR